jgi:hypothetical protein
MHIWPGAGLWPNGQFANTRSKESKTDGLDVEYLLLGTLENQESCATDARVWA